MPFSNEWYKTPFNSYLGNPANVFSLEDLIEADKKMEETKNKVKEEQMVSRIEKEQHLLSSSIKQNWKI